MAKHISENDSTIVKHRITFQPMGISCQALEGRTIMEIASEQNIILRSDCGGLGQCGQCLVDVTPAEHLSILTDNEYETLSPERMKNGGRLACEARIKGPLSVSVSDSVLDSKEAVGKALDGEFFAGKQKAIRGDTDAKTGSLGISLDIGTTTLALYLCDLNSGEVLMSAAEANPQRRYGEDVISRIAYTNDQEDGLSELRQVLIEKINNLIAHCLVSANADTQAIQRVTVVGNTTMQHIFSGLHPRRLGVSPYMPLSCDSQNMNAAQAGLSIDESSPVHLFPVISGFIGGDTVGVILSEKPHERDEISLIIDIGTNGEIVLGNKEALWVTSCATGPALEGAHIESGMRASSGAIQKVFIDPTTYHVDYEMVGNDETMHPKGICGSGVIDAIAEMLKAGLILPSGRLCEGLPGVVEDENGIGRKFVIVPAGESSIHHEIAITLADVRQVQLAKAALSTGIKLLMRKAGIKKFDRLVLTGAFGARFNWQNAVTIGMLPEESYQADVLSVENAAGQGAILALLDENVRKNIQAVAGRAHVLELAEDPDFIVEFTEGTKFSDKYS